MKFTEREKWREWEQYLKLMHILCYGTINSAWYVEWLDKRKIFVYCWNEFQNRNFVNLIILVSLKYLFWLVLFQILPYFLVSFFSQAKFTFVSYTEHIYIRYTIYIKTLFHWKSVDFPPSLHAVIYFHITKFYWIRLIFVAS